MLQWRVIAVRWQHIVHSATWLSLVASLTFSSVVTPHKNCYSHHDEGISVHGVLPHRVLTDVGHLLGFLRPALIVDLRAASAAEPTNQTTDARLFFLFGWLREEGWISAVFHSSLCQWLTFFTCTIAVPRPLFCLSPGSSPFLLLVPVQVLPLLFGVTQAEHQTMELKGQSRTLFVNQVLSWGTFLRNFLSNDSALRRLPALFGSLDLNESLTCWSSMGWVQ